MYRADKAAAALGVPGVALKENAGCAVAEAVRARYQPCPVVVLCGPGNNGGDGFVAARHLAAAGWSVRLALLGARDRLSGDAAHHAGLWDGAVEALDESAVPGLFGGAELVIDALFGAGLSRPLEGAARAAVEAVNAGGLAVAAVDVPSGVSGDSGALVGEVAVRAALTVTVLRKKPGHLLLPGRLLCGEVVVADIGIPETVLTGIAPRTFENGPARYSALARPSITQRRFRADAAFAIPALFDLLEAEGWDYAVRIKGNPKLHEQVAWLTRWRPGRPPNHVVRHYTSFHYRAKSWSKARRVVAKVEFHPGELFPRVGFIVTNRSLPNERVLAFYNGRGTAEQHIKEGKYALKWTRLSCMKFTANAVRLQLHALAYNLANFLRTLATPELIERWSLTSLRERLIKTGTRLVRHGRYAIFQMAAAALPRAVFAGILGLINGLRGPPAANVSV